MYSDSHCHLDLYDPDLLIETLEDACQKYVQVIITMGMDLDSSIETLRLAHDIEGVWAAIGIHPWNAINPTREIRRKFEIMADREFVAAIGEIGLDFARNPETKEVQKELLKYELSLARKACLPVNLHCREAHQDMMDILRPEAEAGLTGIIHGFNGGPAELRDWLDLDFYISIGLRGLLIDESPILIEAIKEIPYDRLLTETDATGQRSHPQDVASVVQKLAAIYEAEDWEIADIATLNLRRLLCL